MRCHKLTDEARAVLAPLQPNQGLGWLVWMTGGINGILLALSDRSGAARSER